MLTVRVPIDWGRMTGRQRRRLDRMTRRDTRVIRAYLGVIEHHEREVVYAQGGGRRLRVDAGALDRLTLRTRERRQVAHDFKRRFPNISTNELQECRETAIAMWESFLRVRATPPMRARGYRPKKIPRYMFERQFRLVYTPDKRVRHWLVLRDSLDSVRQGRRRHDRLAVPLRPSSYHLSMLRRGTVKSIQVFKDRRRKWWVLFRVRITPPSSTATVTTDSDPATDTVPARPPAVLGIDLGIRKAACSVLLTPDGLRHVRFWRQEEKTRRMERYDRIFASLQRRREEKLRAGLSADGVSRRLRALKTKRRDLSIDHDRRLVRRLCDHIVELSRSYDIYVAIGRLAGIRRHARRSSGHRGGRRYRHMITRWSFARVTEWLVHALRLAGVDASRVRVVSEQWTSITCSRCGRRGVRPRQSLFVCPTCGYRVNADVNGAINIARRLIMLIPSLRNESSARGQWLLPSTSTTVRVAGRTTPRARRSARRSDERCVHSERSPASPVGVTVVDRYEQASLERYVSGADPAMETRTVEDPSAATRDSHWRPWRTNAAGGGCVQDEGPRPDDPCQTSGQPVEDDSTPCRSPVTAVRMRAEHGSGRTVGPHSPARRLTESGGGRSHRREDLQVGPCVSEPQSGAAARRAPRADGRR